MSRLLGGRIKDVTTDVERLVICANNGNSVGNRLLDYDARLVGAIDALWDGTDEGMQRLVDALEAAGPLLRLITIRSAVGPGTGSR